MELLWSRNGGKQSARCIVTPPWNLRCLRPQAFSTCAKLGAPFGLAPGGHGTPWNPHLTPFFSAPCSAFLCTRLAQRSCAVSCLPLVPESQRTHFGNATSTGDNQCVCWDQSSGNDKAWCISSAWGVATGKKTFPIIEQTKPAEKKTGYFGLPRRNLSPNNTSKLQQTTTRCFFPAGRKYQIIKSYGHWWILFVLRYISPAPAFKVESGMLNTKAYISSYSQSTFTPTLGRERDPHWGHWEQKRFKTRKNVYMWYIYITYIYITYIYILHIYMCVIYIFKTLTIPTNSI